MLCPKCGTENDEDAKYCEGCGQSLQKSIPKPKHKKNNAVASSNSQESKRNGIKRDIIGLSIIGGIVLVLALVLLIAHSSTAGTTSTNYITGVYNESGVYFIVPDGWEAVQKNYTKTTPSVAYASNGNVTLFIYRYDGAGDSAKEEANTQAEYIRNWGSVPITTSATINGDKGYSVFGYDGVQLVYDDQYFVKKGNYVYVLDFSCEESNDSTGESIAMDSLSSSDVYKILNSFKA